MRNITRIHVVSLPTLLLLLGAVPPAKANVINTCSAFATAGEVQNSCTFSNNSSNLTGVLTIDKTFTQFPGTINASLGLTNTIAGNNVPGIFIYSVTETIHNNSGVDWFDFHITSPNASSVGSPTVSGFTSCTNPTGNAFDCSGGTVTSGSAVTINFRLGTPSDQTSGAFFIGQSPSVPEPQSWTMAGFGLVALGWLARRRASAA